MDVVIRGKCFSVFINDREYFICERDGWLEVSSVYPLEVDVAKRGTWVRVKAVGR